MEFSGQNSLPYSTCTRAWNQETCAEAAMMAATLSLIFEEQQNHHHRGLLILHLQPTWLPIETRWKRLFEQIYTRQTWKKRHTIHQSNHVTKKYLLTFFFFFLLSLKRMVTRTITWHSMNLRVIIKKEFRFYEQPFVIIWA